MSLTFFTSIGPGREEILSIWEKMLCAIPNDVKGDSRYVVVLDTDEFKKEEVIRLLEKFGFSDYAVLRSVPPSKTMKSITVAHHLASIWNRLKYLFEGTVISIEHDITVTRNEMSEFLRDVERTNPAVMGCPILGRGTGHLMVYELKQTIPFNIDRKFRAKQAKEQISEVGSVSLGLCSIRSDIAKSCQWTGNPNPDGTGGNGHEWSLMRYCAVLKEKIFCNWKIRPRHYMTSDSFRQYGLKRNVFPAECEEEDNNYPLEDFEDLDAKVCITGCAQSGTIYMHKCLKKLGLDIGHERLGVDGAIGWFYAANDKWDGYGEDRGSREESSFKKIVHQIRNPVEVIRSITWMHRKQYRFIRRQIGILEDPRKSMVQCAARFWLKWNELAESCSEWSYRIEDVYEGSDTKKKLLRWLGLNENTQWPNVRDNTDHWPRKEFSFDMIESDLAKSIIEYARKFGYEV